MTGAGRRGLRAWLPHRIRPSVDRWLERASTDPGRLRHLPLRVLLWARRRSIRFIQDRRAARIIRQSGRFDSDYYLALHPDVAASGADPIWHYATVGHRAMCNPCAGFDTRYYLHTNPEVRERGINPFVHYIMIGERLGLHPRFPVDLSGRNRACAARASAPSPAVSVTRPGRRAPDVAVVLHVFYAELWPEMQRYLANIDEPFDLYVSMSGDDPDGATRAMIQSAYPDAFIRKTVNRGRDIAPFLLFLNDRDLAAHAYVCKIHTKKSPHVEHGDRWRRSLLDDLLGTTQQFRSIRRMLETDPRTGICGPASAYVATDPYARGNAARVVELCRALDIPPAPTPFFGGSMFWFRPQALEPLARLALTADDFEPELGQVDETLAHAVERAFTLVARHAGFNISPTPTRS